MKQYKDIGGVIGNYNSEEMGGYFVKLVQKQHDFDLSVKKWDRLGLITAWAGLITFIDFFIMCVLYGTAPTVPSSYWIPFMAFPGAVVIIFGLWYLFFGDWV